MPAADLSFVHLILNASLVVKLVMLVLVIASVVSWTMIFMRRHQLMNCWQGAVVWLMPLL